MDTLHCLSLFLTHSLTHSWSCKQIFPVIMHCTKWSLTIERSINKSFVLIFFLMINTGNQEDYEYMRKFSSTDDSINQSSPTSSYHYPVYSQLDKSGTLSMLTFLVYALFWHILNDFLNFENFTISSLDYVMDEYYNRPNMASPNVNYNNNVITDKSNLVTTNDLTSIAPVRPVRKRNTANKKERRRTQSINSAYTSLRDHIPNVPSDTKLSKVTSQLFSILRNFHPSNDPLIRLKPFD